MASSKKSLIGAFAANVAIAATKFIVGGITGSRVMITEAIHSVVDTGNSGLMMFGRRRSKRGPDETHPFGYGMELYFWSFVVAMVVFGGGGGVSIYEGVTALASPHPLPRLWPNYLVIALAAVFEGISLAVSVREFERYRREIGFAGSKVALIRASKNPAMFLTILEDSAALVGLAIAAIGVTLQHLTGSPMYDGIASILIGVVLVVEALILGIECRELIIGEAARPPVVARIERTIERHVGELKCGEPRTLQLGPDAILVVVPVAFPTTEARDLATLAAALRAEVPAIRDVVFEVQRGVSSRLAAGDAAAVTSSGAAAT